MQVGKGAKGENLSSQLLAAFGAPVKARSHDLWLPDLS